MSPKSVYIHTKRLDETGYPEGCPFNTRRAGKTLSIASSKGMFDYSYTSIEPPVPATRKELEMFHTPEYLDEIIKAGKGALTKKGFKMGIGTSDCPVFENMYEYLSLASGATVTGAKMIIDGSAKTAFNPSGGFHHAGPATAAGFCFINDIVLGIKTLLNKGKRVALLDIDVHHFDGVQNAFYETDQVLAVSMHQDGNTLFPGTGSVDEIGRGEGKGYTVNIPLPPGTHNGAYYKAFRETALPVIKSFEADVIVMEIGMDGLSGDPLADLSLSNSVYIDITEDILNLNKPLLATGGGGYNFSNTVRGWALMWSVLSGSYQDDISIGTGGVLLENTDWVGGLKDREVRQNQEQTADINRKVDRIIEKVKAGIFELHGL